jgi:hypothetical protein
VSAVPADHARWERLHRKDPAARAANIAFGLAGGLPYQPWAAELVKQRAATDE